MTFQDLYLGQRVRILSWDELNSISHHDSAYGLYLPDNSFFNSEMKYLCGATLTIVNEPSYFDRDKRYLSSDIFQFDDPFLSLSRGTLSTAEFPIVRVNHYPSPNFDSYYLDGSTAVFISPMFEQSKPQSVPPSSLSFDSLLQGGDFF